MKGSWTEPDLRDEVIDYVRKWSEKTGLPATRLVDGLGISRSKYYDWRRRYGKVNEHNAWIPRDHWLEPWEKEAIIGYCLHHRDEGYRRLTYMMMDAGLVAVSPSSVYRVLKCAGLLGRWNRTPSKKGTGFQQPLKAHEHWHTDISYINICGTFYYLCSVLDGFSRYVVHWEIREAMTEADVQIVLQRARECFPDAHPRIISDNGPQFIAKDFKEFIRLSGMTHVRTAPFYPQSNGKQERWHATLKRDCIRPGTPLNLEDARRIVADFVAYYNEVRLHSAIGYIAPRDKLAGRAEGILAEREQKLAAAREARKARRRETNLTQRKEESILPLVGETDASSAGAQLARDSRPGRRASSLRSRIGCFGGVGFVMGVYSQYAHSPRMAGVNAQRPSIPQKTPGSGAEPQAERRRHQAAGSCLQA
jgi:transposase InsO family protein